MKTKPELTTKTLIPFLIITFGMTWGVAALLIFFYDQVVAIFGEISMTNPLFILAVYAPGFASIFLIMRHYGFKGLGSFFRRLTLWRTSKLWWLFLIFAIPTIMFIGAGLHSTTKEIPAVRFNKALSSGNSL